ncbi:MAG TPA: hypothetical protein VI248_17890, partial [Kineosporiaceae bacterium]
MSAMDGHEQASGGPERTAADTGAGSAEALEAVDTVDAGARPEPQPGGDTLDFFGASPPPTLPATPPPVTRPLASPGAAPTPPAAAPTPAPPAGRDLDPGAAPGQAAVRRGIRVRTIVFGLVMMVISAVSLVSLLTRVRVDAGIVVLGVLIGAGAALLIGGLTAAVRDVRHG